MGGHQHHTSGIDQEVRPPVAPASVHEDRSDQRQQEQGGTQSERPRYQKGDRPNRLERPDDASVEIGWAEMQHRVDAAPEQGETECHMKDQEGSPDSLALCHIPSDRSAWLGSVQGCRVEPSM
jgi:hypothetical protein